LRGFGPTVTALSGSGTILNSTSGTSNISMLTVTGGGAFGGTIRDGGLGGNAPTQLVLGGGALVLSGSNSYTGGTVVLGGTLTIAASNSIAPGTSLTLGNSAAFAAQVNTGNSVTSEAISKTSVPEPASLVLLGASAIAWLCRWRVKIGRSRPVR
jgi:fibronectin-binding autotransporter adhesin